MIPGEREQERVDVMTQICKVLTESGYPALQAKLIQYEVTDSRMTINDARRIIGLPELQETP